jgi:hypothetical protein
MRRVLGHKKMETTSKFYTGLETIGAARHFDAEILKLREKQISHSEPKARSRKIQQEQAMSGGPYGRGKVPERSCMKRSDWQETDQNLWLAAITPSNPFVGLGGSRAAQRAISNRNIERGYGRWLTFLARRGMLDESRGPSDRITPDLARAYVEELDSLGNKRNTILARLEELTEMAKVVGPLRDWGFLRRMSARVRARPDAISNKQARLVGADQLFGLGLELMESAVRQAKPVKSAVLFRDGLIIALLALRPLRLHNLAGLTLGRDLLNIGENWTHRPILLARKGRWHTPVGNRLWVSWDSSPFTEVGIYHAIIRRTLKVFGRSVNPHLFRDVAATDLAIHDPVHVRLAAPLLGHRTFRTTESSYIQARSLEAHRKYTTDLVKFRHAALDIDHCAGEK